MAANEHLGLPADARSYRSAAASCGAGLFRIGWSPTTRTRPTLQRAGIHVEQILPSPAPVTDHNRAYLATKR